MACIICANVCNPSQADGELDGRYSEHSKLLERSIRSMDARAVGLHACAERACSFFSAVAVELEAHEEREAVIDEAAEQRVRCHDKATTSGWRDPGDSMRWSYRV